MSSTQAVLPTEEPELNFTVLVVDDNEMNRDMLFRRLRPHGYHILLANNGIVAMDLLRSNNVDLVLLDVMMPEKDGYEVLAEIKGDELLKRIPVIMITALDDTVSAARCINMGADDYLTKPFNPTLLRARVGASLERKRLHDQETHYLSRMQKYNSELETRVREQVAALTSAQLGAIFAMSKLAESRDPETGAHLERMREYCKVISIQLSRLEKYKNIIDDTFVNDIYAASPLHDIGKVGIDDQVLLKPGKLTAEEWDIMKTHPIIGADTLREVDKQHPGNSLIRMGVQIAEGHHEKWDGSGYPYGLQGESIPLVARILAIGDVYDALTSKRCYKDAFSHEKSAGIILEGRGSHFDPAVVEAFETIEDEFKRIRAYYADDE